MKARLEPQGLHYYCRKSGTHVLFDEIKTSPKNYSLAPRTVSIAITDECDFTCSYCYVNLQDRYLNKEEVINFCKELDKHGTFDIALGGGEPTLHPDLIEICETIWTQTNLGISITTHGHNLNADYISRLKGFISFIRVSIDGIEPIYSKLRKKPLDNLLPNLKMLKGNIPFGINAVINKLTVTKLDDLKSLFYEYDAFELLLLPMWHKGKFVLAEDDWLILNDWIKKNHSLLPIRVSSEAKKYLKLPYLFDSEDWYNDYGFIGIDKTLRKNSFTRDGLDIKKYDTFSNLLSDWRDSLA
ncbi:radical SAM protein [Chryseobacterium taeanense]|jgi:sulfatase maturation enzyme AslB (radical SAM superfamily)|uniref:radical SAM protein n=1 Tax=Chryseobacterium taeanense TaxID=311334 RepID=UPI0035AE13D5